jgi:CheY-like chemotaxis protein/HPt (histidine-containing phosphotransfer) domain-containing protein
MARILVADDAALSRAALQHALASLGHEAELVEDGLQAIAKLSQPGYAAAFFDCHMPRMDGFQAVAVVRRLPAPLNALPVIALTGADGEGDAARCLEAGMTEVLHKPVDVEALRAVLARHLGEAPTPAPAPAAPSAPVSAPGGPLAAKLAAIFVAEAPELIRQIRAGMAAQDAEAVFQAAHKLRGMALTVGVPAVAELCAVLERAGQSGTLSGLGSYSARLSLAYDQARAALSL